jgi:transcriptional regulator with XRE-family HTH domain
LTSKKLFPRIGSGYNLANWKAAMMKRGHGVVEQLRAAIKSSGLTLTQLSVRAGVSLPPLTRFMKGERGITFTTAEKLCEALGLELSKVEPPAPKKATGRTKKKATGGS